MILSLAWGFLFFIRPSFAETNVISIQELPGEFHGFWVATPETRWDRYFENAGRLFGAYWAGSDPYSRNVEIGFMPASTSKIFSAGIALDLMGADFTFDTKLNYRCVGSGGSCDVIEDLEIEGGGDPTWGNSRFGNDSSLDRLKDFARRLYDEGVREVRGPVRARSSDPRYDQTGYPEGWMDEDYIASYGAITLGFNLSGNFATMEVTGPTSGQWVSENIPSHFDVQLTSGRRTSIRSIDFRRDPETGVMKTLIRGTWGGQRISLTLPVHDTLGWARNLLKKALIATGIAVHEDLVPQRVGTDRSLTFHSVSLQAILMPCLKESDNFLADSIWKKVASVHGGSSENLYEAIDLPFREHLVRVSTRLSVAGEVSLPLFQAEQIELKDGSGLSRESRVTPRALTWYLRDFTTRGNFASFWAALPIAGVDGTLANRMRGTEAQNRLRAKTGTLSDVSNLSGLIPLRNGAGYLPFTLLSKDDQRNGNSRARSIQDQVGATLTHIVRSE